MWDTRDMIKVGQMCGVPLLKKGRRDWRLVLFCHDMKGRNCKKGTMLGKGSLVGRGRFTTSADVCAEVWMTWFAAIKYLYCETLTL